MLKVNYSILKVVLHTQHKLLGESIPFLNAVIVDVHRSCLYIWCSPNQFYCGPRPRNNATSVGIRMAIMRMVSKLCPQFSTGDRDIPDKALAERRLHWNLISELVNLLRDSKDGKNRGNKYEDWVICQLFSWAHSMAKRMSPMMLKLFKIYARTCDRIQKNMYEDLADVLR